MSPARKADPGWLLSAWDTLRDELRYYPGRGGIVFQFVLFSALTLVISQALQVRMLALSIIMVFYTFRETVEHTRLAAITNTIIASTAVGGGILLLMFTMDYPLLRMLGVCVIVFVLMFWNRATKLGPGASLVAVGVVWSVTLLDTIADPEQATRALLWAWVAMIYPIWMTWGVQLLLAPSNESQLRDAMLVQLRDVERILEAFQTGGDVPRTSLDEVERDVVLLQRLEVELKGPEAWRTRIRVETVDRLRTAAVILGREDLHVLESDRNDVNVLQEGCAELCRAIQEDRSPRPEAFRGLPSVAPAVGAFQEMAHALTAWFEVESGKVPARDHRSAKVPLFAPDAFRNPLYLRYSLKATLAALLSYIFYTGTQWPGTHTAPLTCLLLAVTGLGGSVRKGILRVSGCALGSLIALICTVFVFPRMDGITGLLLCTLLVVAVAAWFHAGSVRSNYVGVQTMFAFSLALLSPFGFSGNLEEIRDRLMGILVGTTIYLAVSVLLWPERETTDLRALLARLVRGKAGLARGHDSGTHPAHVTEWARRLWSWLTHGRELAARVDFEPDLAAGSAEPFTGAAQDWFAQARTTLFSLRWLQTLLHLPDQEPAGQFLEVCTTFREAAADCLERMADQLGGEAPPRPEGSDAFTELDRCQSQAEAMAGGAGSGRTTEILAAMNVIHRQITRLSRSLAVPEAHLEPTLEET